MPDTPQHSDSVPASDPGAGPAPGVPIRVAYVDVLVMRFRPADGAPEFLCLRRGPAGRSPGSWEAVHGHIDPAETPVETALRELAEETGLTPERFYNLSRVEMFYRHSTNEVVLVPVFVAVVAVGAEVRLSAEHDGYEWLDLEAARGRVSWPRIAREMGDAVELLWSEGVPTVGDVLWIHPAN